MIGKLLIFRDKNSRGKGSFNNRIITILYVYVWANVPSKIIVRLAFLPFSPGIHTVKSSKWKTEMNEKNRKSIQKLEPFINSFFKVAYVNYIFN
jgi:hypothetical protein